MISIYADQMNNRLRMARIMGEVAKSGPDFTAQPDLDTDVLRGLAEALSEQDRTAKRLAGKGISEAKARARGEVNDAELMRPADDGRGEQGEG